MTRWCLVVEDERPLARMIGDNLQLEGYGVEIAGDGDEALTRLERGGIDVVVLDVMLPRRDGFSVLRAMRRRGDTTPVLILSARGSDADRIVGLELAADDYLPKPFNLRELLLRVGALLRRGKAVPPGADLLAFGGNRVDFRSLRARRFDGSEVELTATEARLLRLLSGRDGTVVGRREIVEQLFGPGTPLTTRTLDNLVLALRRYFEPDGRAPRHLHTVRGLGLRFTAGPDPAP
jgi:two-component system alkaline phosphatase synthesis response regulator PhoP